MVYISADINQVVASGKILALEPQVHIGLDAEDNLDKDKLLKLQKDLVGLLWKGLNDAIVMKED